MSNKFSSARTIQKRPKVCLPPPPPPPPPPVGEPCAIMPNALNIAEMGGGEVQVKANKLPVLEDPDVFVEWVGDEGITGSEFIQNDNEWWLLVLTAMVEPGVYPGSIKFTFEDDSVCSKDITVTVTEMEM